LSFYGGGLDYPEYYKNNNVRILTAALDHYCYQTIRRLPPFFEHNYRAVYSNIELAEKIDEISHPSIRECLNKIGGFQSIEITHIGDLPARSGIGSSSAFTVGLIKGLLALKGVYISSNELARAAIELEQNEMGETVGIQDQCASALGGLVYIKADRNGIYPRRYIARKAYIDYLCENLLLGFNGVARFSQEAAKRVVGEIKRGARDEMLKDLAGFSEAGIKLFSNEADINEHAAVTKSCRDLKLMLNGDIDNKNIQALIRETEEAGSLCTRVLGAGGGGFILCWAPKHRHDQIKSSVNIKTWVDVRISSVGSEIVFYA